MIIFSPTCICLLFMFCDRFFCFFSFLALWQGIVIIICIFVINIAPWTHRTSYLVFWLITVILGSFPAFYFLKVLRVIFWCNNKLRGCYKKGMGFSLKISCINMQTEIFRKSGKKNIGQMKVRGIFQTIT